MIVIGGGHAGCEAAAASARLGARTLLLTHKRATIGAMSCNPAIGGLGRGHLVREIDALDGLMGARDRSRRASSSACSTAARGRRCAGPRAQADRRLYRSAIAALLARAAGPDDRGRARSRICCSTAPGGRAAWSTADGRAWRAAAVVLTTGTFLRGEIHLGLRALAGRAASAMPAAVGLARRLGARWASRSAG